MLNVLLITAAAIIAQATDPAPAPTFSPAMTEARANVARMTTRPELVTGDDPAYPDSEKAARNGGIVWVNGIVTADGHFDEVTVVSSNAGSVLTASALATARTYTFTPAADAAGTKIAAAPLKPFTFAFGTVGTNTITRVPATYDDDARAIGAHGQVTISGLIQADGHLRDAKVAVTSRSPALDQAALTAAQASLFRAYVDGDGKPVETATKITYAFGTDVRAAQHTCAEFAATQSWWRTTWPEAGQDEFYKSIQKVGIAVNWEAYARDPAKDKAYREDFAARWSQAIETCRQKPQAQFKDIFLPEGTYAARMGM